MVCFFLGKQAGRKAQGQDFWWLLFPEETEIRAFFAFSVDNRYGTPRKGGLVPHTTTVNITPPGAVFQARLLDSQEGANQYSERSGLQVPSMPGSLGHSQQQALLSNTVGRAVHGTIRRAFGIAGPFYARFPCCRVGTGPLHLADN